MADVTAYDPVFEAAGNEWNVDPKLLKAMAIQESGGNPRAVSSAGAQGVMQIIPSTQKYLGVTDPNDPVQSIYGAAKYMNEALDKEGTPERALLYYHGGPGWRQNYGSESAAYVPAITAHYQRLGTTSTASASPASTAPPTPTSQLLIIGDSLASKQGLGGTGVIGAQPKAVLDSINGLPDDQVKGRDVILSGGASNNPAQASLVYDQVKALKDRGANSVTVVGVGDRPDLAGVNDTLAMVTGRAGGRFVPVPTDQLSGDRVHPTPQGYRTLLAAATPKTATDAAPAPTPAPAASTGAGNAMASNDPLSLLPPAPKPSAGGGAATAAPDDPLSLLPPAPKPSGAAATTTTQERAPAQDPYSGAPTSDDYQPSPAVTGALSRIGQAAAEGAAEGPHIPRVPGNLVMSAVYNPLIAGAETALRGVSALGRGGMQAIYEAGEPLGRALPEVSIPNITLPGDSSITYPGGITIDRPGRGFGGVVAGGPGLGRDLNLLAQVVPVAQAEGGAMRAAMQPAVAPEVNALQPKFVSERFAPPRPPGMTDAERIQQLIRHDESESAGVGPQTQAGVPGASEPAPTRGGGAAGAPGEPVLTAEERAWAASAQERLQEIKAANQAAGIPGDLGAAATPEQLAQLTPQQVKAYRRQAELGEALAPAPRELDRKIYVEGSKPTRAEYSADPEISQQESLERERAPKQHDAVQEENNAARVRKFEGMMGTDIQVDDLKVAKAKAAEIDGNAFLQAARPIDLKPAADWIDGQLADPRVQARPDVVRKLGDLRKSLFEADGNMRTEPGYGWGLHDEAMADLEKAKDTTRAERYSKSQLLQWKKIIDGVNDDASDGAFRKFLDNQSDYAARINGMELLQKYRPKLTSGKTGMIQPTAFHRFVADLAMRRGNPGIDAAMDLPDETMRGLLNIGHDLKRADNIDLGKARGSPTNLLFSLAKGTGIGMAHAAFSAIPGATGVGNILLQGALNAASTATGNVLLRRRVNRSLAPPPGGYDYSPVQPP